MKKIKFLVLILLVSGCAWTQNPAPFYAPQESSDASRPAVPATKSFYKINDPIQCVPHARKISGIPIFGDAHTWWKQADGKYKKGARPQSGAVLVLSKTSRLKYGHLAVVKRVIDNRTMEVSHSNWGGDRATRCIIYNRMPVKDVSPKNDWSQLRFWHYPSKSFGNIYAASGFIYTPVKTAMND